MHIFVTVGVCVYACICVEMHGGVLLSVFLYLPACMCTYSHLLVWMYVPLNVCVYVFLCTYMHSCLCISVSCMCIHVCVPMLTYTCPCVFMSIVCVHAYVFVYLCVCLGQGGQTESISFVDFPAFFQAITEPWKNKMLLWTGEISASQSAVTHRPHQLSIAYLPWDAEPLVCFLMGPCTSSSSGLQNPCATPSPCQELHAFCGDRGTPVMCKAVFWLVLRPAWQETHGRSCNTRACSWGDNKALVRKPMLVFC